MKKILTFLLTALLAFGVGWAETKTDLLNQTWTGITGSSYTTFSDKAAPSSDAVYAGNCAGSNSSIQLRSNNNNSGIVTTTSGGKVRKITVVWNSNTQSGRTLNVYGKNSAYSSASDLYGSTSTQGTQLGTIVCGTSTTLSISDDYEYIGFRSASGAMYLTSVSIEWEIADEPPVEDNWYRKVTSASDLFAGNKYIIVNEANGVGMGELNNSYGTVVSGLTFDNGRVNIGGTNVMELILGGTSNAWTFRMGENGNYLSNSNSNNNTFFSSQTVGNSATDIAKWTITPGDNARIQSNYVTSQYIRFNSSLSVFGTYGVNTNVVVALYVQDDGYTGVGTISEANSLAANTNFRFTGSAVVTYQNGNNLWIRDASGSGLINGTVSGTFANGAVLDAGWTATKSTSNYGVPQFTSPSGVSSSSSTTAAPESVPTFTTADVNKYLSISSVKITSNSGSNYYYTVNGTDYCLRNQWNLASLTVGKTYNVVGVVSIYNSVAQLYLISAEEVAVPTLLAEPTTLTINDSGTGNTFTVEGSALGTDNVGVTLTNSYFTPTVTATVGTTYDGGTYRGFTPANGSLAGEVAINYTGRELSASDVVSLGTYVNGTQVSATVTVNYRSDVYILGNYGSGWDYSDGILMTYDATNNTYTASVTADADNLIVFARKLGESNPWNTRYLFGPNSDPSPENPNGDWFVPLNGNGSGNLDLNNSRCIKFQTAGTYIIEIDANAGTFTITKETVATGDFVLVTNVNDLNAGEEVIIVNSGSAGSARTMGQRNNNNYYGTAVTVSNALKVTATETTQIFTLEAGTGGWYFKTSDDLYLNNANSGSSNYLQTKAKDGNGTNTSLAAITIGSSNAATIQFQGGGNKYLRYNPNGITSNPNANDIFSCYSSATNQQNVFIYKREASTEPTITVNPTSMELVIPAGGSSQSGTATVTEENTTGTTSVGSITGDGAGNFTAVLNNGTLTVTYTGTATQANPDQATITLINGSASATVNVTGYKEPITVTITPADGHTFQGSTVTGMIESNVAGATIEYSFDGTTWQTYDPDEGFTATVSSVGGTVTVYARATYNGETATAQATYTRIAPSTHCYADIVFAPTSNNGEMSQWSTFVTHIGEGTDYLSSGTVSKLWTNTAYNAMRFGSGNYTGELAMTLDLTKFTSGACKLTKVIVNAARYGSDGNNCELKVSTNVNTTGVTLPITNSQTNFADYVFNFNGSEITSLTIENTSTNDGRVYVHSITLEYTCGSSVPAPVITPATGTYYEDHSVSITADDGCTIYYTTNGSDPTTSSPVYTDPFNVACTPGSTTTIKAIAVDGDGVISDVATEVYTWAAPTVHIHPDSRNTTASSMSVTLTPDPAGAQVYYTTDGSTPSPANGTLYTGPFTVSIPNVGDAVTVKAIAVMGNTSAVATATYTHVESVLDVNVPFFSPLKDHTYYGDQTLQIGCTTPNADIYYEIVEVSGATAPDASSVEDPTHVSTHYDGSTINMTVGNSYYVKAIAYIGNNASTISEGWYTILEAPTTQYTYTNLKDFNDHCPTGVTAHFVNPVQVVYHSTYTNNGQFAEFCYLRDNTDYACVYFGKRDTNGYHIFKMGDWIDGSQIAGVTNIWERNFHIQLGTGNHEVSNWPSQAIGWSEILPEEMTNDVIVAGTSDGDNVWGHYVHLRNTRLSEVDDYSASDPKHTGKINDGTADAYYYDKFYRWSAGTCTYTTGGNTYTDQINCLGDYDQDFFTTKQNAGATFDVYGVIDYYSEYTPPFEMCPIDFLWVYKPEISLPTGTYGSTQTVTISPYDLTQDPDWWAAEGVVIYYKTEDMEEWAVYKGPITVNSTTTIQAYAEVPSEKTDGANYNDYVRSEIVEATYTFVGVEDPIIDPENQVKEDGQTVHVTVMDNNDNANAVTVYTTDGTVPSATNGTVLDEITEFDVTTTTTVSAVSYLVVAEGDTLWSNVVTRTYEFITPNGKTYDLLMTNPVVGNIYVIVNKADKVGLSTTQNANNRAATSVTFTDATKTVVNGHDALSEFILESANAGRYYFREVGTQNYLCVTTNEYANLMTGSADVNAEAAATVNSSVTSGVDESYPATITFNLDGTNRYLRYYSNNRTFTTYGDATTNQDVFLYGIEAPELLPPVIDPMSQTVPDGTIINGTVTPDEQNPEGALTWYTTDGSDPRTSSTRILWTEDNNGAFGNIIDDATVKAVTGYEFGDGYVYSDVVSETYTFVFATSLAWIESEGVVETEYIVANELIGTWAVSKPDGTKLLWAKDKGNQSIDKRPAKTNGQKDYVKDILEYEWQETWDESNWVILNFANIDADPEEFVGHRITEGTVEGIYVNDRNFQINLTKKPELVNGNPLEKDMPLYTGWVEPFPEEQLGKNYSLAYNSYVPANFMTENHNHYANGESGPVIGFVAGDGALGNLEGDSLYFVNPKIQEVAHIWAVWNEDDIFTVYQAEHKENENINAWNLNGTFRVNWTYNCMSKDTGINGYGEPTSLVKGVAYEFHAAIMHPATSGRTVDPQGTPNPGTPSNDYELYPLDVSDDGTPTAVVEIGTNKVAVGVMYYNLMGQPSSTPFEGINIVVTRYSDGSTSTVKVLR